MESGQMTAAPQIHTDAKPVAARPPVLNHLDRLEAESIHILREVMAECRNPVMLFSIGKDSSVLLHLLLKAFHPARQPLPLLHDPTPLKSGEMMSLRDRRTAETRVAPRA